jgi:hypothetical protein
MAIGIQPELWVDRASAAVTFSEAAFDARVLHIVGEGDDIVVQLAIGQAAFWVAAADPSRHRMSLAPDASGRPVDGGHPSRGAFSQQRGGTLGLLLNCQPPKFDRCTPVGHGADAEFLAEPLRASTRCPRRLILRHEHRTDLSY